MQLITVFFFPHPVFAFVCGLCYTKGNQKLRNVPRSAPDLPRRLETMKVLKALLAILTALAVALTAALLFIQDKNAPRYIQIYENEQ